MKKTITSILTAIAAIVLLAMTASAYSVTRVNEGNYYICASSDKNYCIDVENGYSNIGTYVQLYKKSSGNSAQIFTIEHYSGDWYRIRNTATGLVLNVPSANNQNGQRLWMWDSNDTTSASLWRFADAGNGKYVIQNKLGKVIDLDNNITKNSSRLHLWSCHSGASAKWYLVSASASSSKSIPAFSSTRTSFSDGTYKITLHDDSSRCINVLYKSTTAHKALLGVDTYNGETNEQFILKNRGNGYVSIHPKHAPNLCLNAKLANRTPGDVCTLYTYENGDNASLWSIHKYADGTYAIKNKATDLVLDVRNGCYDLGSNVINWTANGYLRAQSYRLTKLSNDSNTNTFTVTTTVNLNTDSNSVEARLNKLINSANYRPNQRYTYRYASEQCKGYAKSLHQELFGYNIGSTQGKPNNHKINYSSRNTICVGSLSYLTTSSLRSLFSTAKAGDFVQIRRNHGGSHSAIVVSANNNSLTVIEANTDNANGIKLNTYTWNKLISDNQKMSLYRAKNYR